MQLNETIKGSWRKVEELVRGRRLMDDAGQETQTSERDDSMNDSWLSLIIIPSKPI